MISFNFSFPFSIAELNNGDYLHGPHVDPENSTDGKVVFVNNQNPDIPDQSGNIASMISPIHRNAMASCVFEFWYYIAGDTSNLQPILISKNFDRDLILDMLKPDSEGVGQWRTSVNGIGRQREDFQIRLTLEPSATFDAGVAIDDLGSWFFLTLSFSLEANHS